MKSNLKVLAEKQGVDIQFDAIASCHVLGRELAGYTKTSENIDIIQKQLEDLKLTKIERKKHVDQLLKDLRANDVKLGKDTRTCPYKKAIKSELDKAGLARGTIQNIIHAVDYAMTNGKAYDIHFRDKVKKAENARVVEQAKQVVETQTATPATPTNAPTKKGNSDLTFAEIKQNAMLILPNLQASFKKAKCTEIQRSASREICELIDSIFDILEATGSKED